MKLVIKWAVLFLFAYLHPAYAEGGSVFCGKQLYLLYANGMNNTKYDAYRSLQLLVHRLQRHLNNNDDLNWRRGRSAIAYNYDSILATELLEVLEQKDYESTRQYWEWYNNATDAPQFYKDAMARLLQEQLGQLQSRFNLDEQLIIYRNLLALGYQVVSVGHSQGNLFVNLAYDVLAEDHNLKERLSAVAVATPAKRVAGDGPYITLTSDGVINLILRLSLNTALPANFTNSAPKPGWFDHDFATYYLNGIGSGARLTSMIQNQMQQLQKSSKPKELQISEECQQWWLKLAPKINIKTKDGCMHGCAFAATDMATFDCTGKCETLCDCELAGNNAH